MFKSSRLRLGYFKQNLEPKADLYWLEDKAPVAFSNRFKSIDELRSYLKEILQNGNLVSTNHKNSDISDREINRLFLNKTPLNRLNLSHLGRTWIALVIFVLPIFWMIFLAKLVNDLISSVGENLAIFFTFLMLIIVALSFVSPLFYYFYREREDDLDLNEQIQLLVHIINSNPNKTTNEIVSSYIFSKNGRLFWRKYKTNWRLSLFYPELSIIDISGIVFSTFSIVYLLAWITKSLSLISLQGKKLNSHDTSVLILDIILIGVIVGWIISGIIYGKNSDWHLQLIDSERLIKINSGLLGGGIILLIILEFIGTGINGTYLFLLLIAETPLLTAFVTNRFLLVKEYNEVKNDIKSILSLNSVELVESLSKYLEENSSNESDKIMFNLLVNQISHQLTIQNPIIPSTRLRSYAILVTFIVSIISSLISAFNSSVDRFSEIISIFDFF